MPIFTVTFVQATYVQATYVMAAFVHISNISRQGQGRVRIDQNEVRVDQGKVIKARSRQVQGNVKAR